MLFRNFFTPIIKETPREATISSHILMLRAGMIMQLASGIYSWLPLGLKTLRNVENIVRKTMNEAGAQEILMPCIQPASLWQESGRYDAYGKEMLRITDRHENSLLFGPTNEEVVTDIFRKNVKSYKDLPMNLYHIQWKFRDEIRPRFGVMRGREFLMKDAYSFDIDFEGAKKSYDTMFAAYFKTFRKLGLNAIALRADSGAIGGNLSHEFHIVANTGESAIFYDKKFDELSKDAELDIETMKSLYAAADEMHNPADCPIAESQIAAKRGIEVGHIFYFGTKYSEAMGAYVTGKDGQQKLAEMGSYGIGVSRLIGAIIEANHDENGIIWPEEMAPFKYALINLKPGNEDCDKLGSMIYQKFLEADLDILYDDTDNSAGSKFATHDLIGTPWQFAIGPRSAANGVIEVKNRRSGEKIEMSLDSLFNKFLGK